MAQSLLKVIISQLHAKYGVDIGFEEHGQLVIHVTNCINGALLHEAAEAITNMQSGGFLETGVATVSSPRRRFLLRVVCEHHEGWEDLKRAVINSRGRNHIVAHIEVNEGDEYTHAIVPQSVTANQQVSCLDHYQGYRSNSGGSRRLANSKNLSSFHIIDTAIRGVWLPQADGTLSLETNVAALPPVLPSWEQHFGTTLEELESMLESRLVPEA